MILNFIKERNREVSTSDLFDDIMRQFGPKLNDRCSDVVFSDETKVEIDQNNDINYAHDDDIIFCCNEEDLKSNCV